MYSKQEQHKILKKTSLTQMAPSLSTFTVLLKQATSVPLKSLSWLASSLATNPSASLCCAGVPPPSMAAAKTMVAAACEDTV